MPRLARRAAWIVAAALALPAARPLAAQGAPLRVPASVDTLKNGLRLIIHEDHSTPVVSVNVWFHVGSGDEKPGRTGFAHLFEHLMFMGSEHAPYPEFDTRLEAAGASNNGSTTEDRTNYYESGPATALPLMLWLEADRLGWLLPTMDKPKVDLQRDVVKNERRQRVDNQPYGVLADVLPPVMYPAGHPYSWPVIGSMADLSAASVEDVKDFFRTYYAPNNAVVVVAGDVRADSVRALARKYFEGVPRGPAITRPDPAALPPVDTVIVLEDRVQLPRLYLNWRSVKNWAADDAALSVAGYVLAGARNARLTQALVYNSDLATAVNANQNGQRLAGEFSISATARPGKGLDTLRAVVEREVARLSREGPTARELEQARNAIEAGFLRNLENVNGKADQLNEYYFLTGKPDAFQSDLDRYRAVTADDVKRVVAQYLTTTSAMISIVPNGKKELAAKKKGVAQ